MEGARRNRLRSVGLSTCTSPVCGHTHSSRTAERSGYDGKQISCLQQWLDGRNGEPQTTATYHGQSKTTTLLAATLLQKTLPDREATCAIPDLLLLQHATHAMSLTLKAVAARTRRRTASNRCLLQVRLLHALVRVVNTPCSKKNTSLQLWQVPIQIQLSLCLPLTQCNARQGNACYSAKEVPLDPRI